MSWASLLSNPWAIKRVYDGNPPELVSVPLHAVDLNREGPTLSLRFDMPIFPENPPKKWTAQGFDAVQVTLTLGGVRNVSFSGFTTSPVVEITLTARNGVELTVRSPAVEIHAAALTVHIAHVSAYRTATS
ncbi:Imm50 family immunity protein [Streptomyces sp. SBC-4]|nr:Imm50 family immunity protein [Streptomyces sp. SBC-4]MDV5146879.1 Imm50 family immunity protein [Streptomyces sp. SBC-4]